MALAFLITKPLIKRYGNVVSPAAQGEARVMATNNWLQISTKLRHRSGAGW